MKIEFQKVEIDPDFLGYSDQDINEQIRKMRMCLESGLNPFTGKPYGLWETHRYVAEDIDRVKAEMTKYTIGY
jgi:hypothetical protein